MKQQRRHVRIPEGFTMVELLVTMLLLTVALVGLAALQLYSVRQTTASRRANEATRLGQAVVERYMAYPNGAAALGTTGSFQPEPVDQGTIFMDNVNGDGLVPGSGPFSVKRLIEDYTGADGNLMKLITVRVSWKEHPPGSTPTATARVWRC